MPLINDIFDNNRLKELIKKYNFDNPTFWVNDSITFNLQTKDIVYKKYSSAYWDNYADKYLSGNLMTKFKVIYKRKYDKNEPWWSRIKNEINGEELWFLDDGLVKIEPSYKPKKIDRTLESINNNYTGYVFQFDNIEDFIEMQTKLFKKEIVWITGEDIIKSTLDELDCSDYDYLEYPLYIFIDMIRKKFFFRPSDDLDYNDPIVTLKSGIRDKSNIDDTVYSISDFNKVFKVEPSYKPRKIERFLESNKPKIKYRFKTEEEFIKEFGENWKWQYPKQVKWNSSGQMDYLFGQPIYIDADINLDKYSGNDVIIYIGIDNQYNSWSVFKNMIKLDEPSYKPKKIERTLESKNSLLEAKEITVVINNYDEMEILKNSIKPLGYIIPDNFLKLIKNISPINIFIDLKTKGISQTTLSDYQRQNWGKILILNGVWEKELIINDLPHIINILKEGKIMLISPSYKPKKVKRTLENLNESAKNSYYFNKYNSLIIIIEEKLNEEKIKYFSDLFNQVFSYNTLNFTLNFNHVFESVCDDIDDFNYIAIRYDGVGWGTPDMLEENNKSKNATFPRYFNLNEVDTLYKINSILDYGDVIPSYKPKKIERSIDESADYLEVKKDGKTIILEFTQGDAIPFGFDENNKLIIGEKGTPHSDFFIEEFKNSFRDDYYIHPKQYEERFGKISPPKIPIEDIEEFYDMSFTDYYTDLYSDEVVNRLEDYTFLGRVWLNDKIISFWDYPFDNDEMKEVINKIEEKLNINIWNDDWSLSIINKQGDDLLIPIKNYEKSETPSKEEWINHIKSPLLKMKKVPKGWGSNHPDYERKRAWQMASLTSENKLYDYNDIENQLKKGKYNFVIFKTQNTSQRRTLKKFLSELEIIGGLYTLNNDLDEYFGIFFNVDNDFRLDKFHLYSIARPEEIENFLKTHYNFGGTISPLFNNDEFIKYIKSCISPNPVLMYQPKKIDRNI